MIPERSELAFVAVCGAVELLLLLRLKRRVRETTLVAAWWWAVAATLGLAAVEAAVAAWDNRLEPGGAAALRLIAAPLVFCPAMAVLGAKRPQHGAWQFIVLSMWGVLALPGAEHLVLQRAGAIEIHGVRTAFVIGLTALGALNWLPTRRWPTAFCVAAGQTALYADQLPGIKSWTGGDLTPWTAFLFATGTALIALQDFFAGREISRGLDRVWRDFRDDFGALWALRVAERVNATAAMQDWPLRLSWNGFHEGPPSAMGTGDALNVTLDNLLRRFVSQQWIAKRREEGVH